MEDLGVYVVRVYRQDSAGMDGIVEAVIDGEQLPFHSSDDLWRALHDLSAFRRRHPSHIANKEEPA